MILALAAVFWYLVIRKTSLRFPVKKDKEQKSQLLTWVGEDLFSRRDVDKLLFRFLLLSLGLEVVRVPLLCQLPVRLDDLLLICIPEKKKQKFLNVSWSVLLDLAFDAGTKGFIWTKTGWTGYLPTPRIL